MKRVREKLTFRTLGCMTPLAGILAFFSFLSLEIDKDWLSLSLNQPGSFWITHPSKSIQDFGVFHFRKNFNLGALPPKFLIHVSADNRYELYVNGMNLLRGPARGDLDHWRYETLDIAPYLRAGRNVLAAVVWNFSHYAPIAQLTYQTAFLIQGDSNTEDIINSNASWKVWANEGVEPLPIDKNKVRGFFAAGPGERVAGNRFPWNWELPDYDDSTWPLAALLAPGGPHGRQDSTSRWKLVPRNIPPMEEKQERFLKIARARGGQIFPGFLRGQAPLKIPPKTRMSFLLDQTYLTTAYPELITQGGRGTLITMTYAEALWRNGAKGNRNEIEGREIAGLQDQYLPDGGDHRLFRPLWWRTYRYLQVEVETGANPLILEDLRGIFTAYPLELRARFESEDAELKSIWDIGWRTARLCAHETFMDCPYYEQLQYVADARIQAVFSYYLSGDVRLAKNAIELLADSRTPEGLTQSRYPSSLPQWIPPFSLLWVGMIHDLWWYQGEPDFVRQFLPAVQRVLAWFEASLTASSLLGPSNEWNFVDWTPNFKNGVPPQEVEGQSAILSLQFAAALREASELELDLGSSQQAGHYSSLAAQIVNAVKSECWDNNRQLMADTPSRNSFSQHGNALAVLLDAIPPSPQESVMRRMAEGSQLTQCSYYFRYYLFKAMNKAGLADQYLEQLQPWREMLSRGLTSWPEKPEPTRSDCHAWSIHPSIGLLATVAGIEPAAAGFRKVIIQPHLGKLQRVKAVMPHPRGMIKVEYQMKGKRLEAEVDLPKALSGIFRWQGTTVPLHEGKQHLEIKRSLTQ